jgi:hypothetical protein
VLAPLLATGGIESKSTPVPPISIGFGLVHTGVDPDVRVMLDVGVTTLPWEVLPEDVDDVDEVVPPADLSELKPK